MDTPEEPLRPLDLDPTRVLRAGRPHYAIIDIGSNSVRLMVYDQLGRAPMPRFNEKSLCRLAEGLAQTAPLRPTDFGEPSKRCDGFAPSPTRWASAGSTSLPPRRSAAPPTDLRSRLQSARKRGLRFASCRAPKRRDTPPWASSPHSFARSELSGTWAAAVSKWRRRSTTVSGKIGSVCRSARCRSRRCSRTDMRQPSAELTRSFEAA